MLIVGVLFATVLLRFAMILAVAYFLVPRGPACPGCGGEMAAIEHRLLALCLPAIEHRWCLACGWQGIVRRGAPGPRSPDDAPRPALKR
ncbi:MAG TPA: hypothetical protein VFK78_01665 [Gemmatimonadales bacterium]|nr:hypothetical protein [Gemmatimonadales bacterium]